jgi:hypothetical protein
MSRQGKTIRDFIVDNVHSHASDIVHVTAKEFSLSRQAVQRHIASLVKQGFLKGAGNTRGRSYKLAVLTKVQHRFPLSKQIEEYAIWDQYIRPRVQKAAKPEIAEICFYGFTEMVNNVIDHSEGRTLAVQLQVTAGSIRLAVSDDGVGIFNKIASALKLDDARQAILELSKGKLTTDPARHTGEGIFFSSRAFDQFSMFSGRLQFLAHRTGDWLFQEVEDEAPGTRIVMEINFRSEQTLKGVFDKFSGGEAKDYAFSRTHVPLKLAQSGDSSLMSRSQAKRVLTRFNRFDEVLLDFDGVKSIGQAFADEIFRVFAAENPRIKLLAVNANQPVAQMISRARAELKRQQEAK